MKVNRGDVVMTRIPHFSGGRGKKRPAVVIQADTYNQSLRHGVVAEVTTNQQWFSDPACLVVDPSAPEGKATGLNRPCVISALHLSTISEDIIKKVIGRISDDMLEQFGECLKLAFELP